MIETIIDNGAGSTEELAVVLFSVARKHSAEYENSQIDNNQNLRLNLRDKIIAECQSRMPEVPLSEWSKAAGLLYGKDD